MSTYSVSEISKIICGNTAGPQELYNLPVSIIATDSRTIASCKQSIFFALVSQRNDGHKYIPELIAKGIKAFVISNEKIPSDFSDENIFIVVNDTLEALQKLAAYNRNQKKYPIIGITGSNGKTIVKEWLYNLLNEQYSIVRSPKSYNSQIGVPLSAWLLEDKHSLAILEAGISQPGEMKTLEKIIQPTIGVFTNIGTAHQENFSGLEEKLKEKIQLFKGANQLVYSMDHENSSDFISSYCQENKIEPINWSSNGKRASIQYRCLPQKDYTWIDATFNNKKYTFQIPFADGSAIENACHCFAVCLALKADMDTVTKKMEALTNVAMRLEIKDGTNHSILINDFYNSDINSLSIALNVLKSRAEKSRMKKIVVLSDIQQSGIAPNDLYTEVNRMISETNIDLLFGIGNDLINHQALFNIPGKFYRDSDEFLADMSEVNFSNSVILLKGARSFNFENIASRLQQKAHQTILEINMNAMIENLNIFRSKLNPTTKIMAMVKAFSYGSGTYEIANLLQFHKVNSLAVAVADEGIELRKAGITIPIVVMNPEIHSFQHIIDYQLEPNIYSEQVFFDFVSNLKLNAVFDFPVHIKLDTGMNRLGFKKEDEIKKLVSLIQKSNLVRISSVFSHLSASDDPQMDSFTREQITKFNTLFKLIQDSFEYKIDAHILNSAGIERFPEHQMDMVRLGIGLYGVSCTNMPLATISTLKTSISQIKEVDYDETIGYSRKGKLPRNGKIAIIPIGYADGLRRALSNGNGRAYLNGNYAPIIGNICMDMCMLDVTGIDASEGDEVEIFGQHISVNELAEKANTIPYEILTGISQRVKRVYVQE